MSGAGVKTLLDRMNAEESGRVDGLKTEASQGSIYEIRKLIGQTLSPHKDPETLRILGASKRTANGSRDVAVPASTADRHGNHTKDTAHSNGLLRGETEDVVDYGEEDEKVEVKASAVEGESKAPPVKSQVTLTESIPAAPADALKTDDATGGDSALSATLSSQEKPQVNGTAAEQPQAEPEMASTVEPTGWGTDVGTVSKDPWGDLPSVDAPAEAVPTLERQNCTRQTDKDRGQSSSNAGPPSFNSPGTGFHDSRPDTRSSPRDRGSLGNRDGDDRGTPRKGVTPDARDRDQRPPPNNRENRASSPRGGRGPPRRDLEDDRARPDASPRSNGDRAAQTSNAPRREPMSSPAKASGQTDGEGWGSAVQSTDDTAGSWGAVEASRPSNDPWASSPSVPEPASARDTARPSDRAADTSRASQREPIRDSHTPTSSRSRDDWGSNRKPAVNSQQDRAPVRSLDEPKAVVEPLINPARLAMMGGSPAPPGSEGRQSARGRTPHTMDAREARPSSRYQPYARTDKVEAARPVRRDSPVSAPAIRDLSHPPSAARDNLYPSASRAEEEEMKRLTRKYEDDRTRLTRNFEDDMARLDRAYRDAMADLKMPRGRSNGHHDTLAGGPQVHPDRVIRTEERRPPPAVREEPRRSLARDSDWSASARSKAPSSGWE